MSIQLVTIAQVKLLLGANANFPDDTLLTLLVQQVSARCQSYLNRDLEDTGEHATEYFNGDGRRRVFPLRRFPISTVTSVHDDIDRNYGSGSLISSSDYAIHLDEGYVEIEYPLQPGMRNVKIIYDGGYLASEGVLPVPDAMKQAALLQSAEVYRRKESMTETSVSNDLGAVSMPVTFDVMDLTPGVKRLLDPFRVIAMGAP